MSPEQPIKTILILAANPKGTVPLRLDEEVREIKSGLKRSHHRDQFQLVYEVAVRPRDVRRAMLDYRPQIVHFCGHGEGDAGLILEDDGGRPHQVSAEALATLFDLFSDQVGCVLLNACYSHVQAEAIARHIGAVIGMSQAIGDRAAIEFATSFYDALGAGQTIDFAYLLGCNAMQLAGVAGDKTPVLIQQPVGQNTQVTTFVGDQRADGAKSRIFISYKRGIEPDEPVALAVYHALRQKHDVFIDQTMTIGTRWAERIETEICQSDFLITFLSEQAVYSEMVVGEIETAHNLFKKQGRPIILPIRLAYQAPFTYPLSAYLNSINWAVWNTDTDTDTLITELQEAIAGTPLPSSAETTLLSGRLSEVEATPLLSYPHPAAQPIFLEMPEGTMDLESQFYVKRSGDELALEAIKRQGVTITVKGPRQMGKSSLLNRTMAAAVQAGKRVAFLDFQLFDQDALTDSDRFFRQFCTWLTDEVELTDRVEEYWQMPLGNSQRCTRYLQRYLLKELNLPLVLAMDEVERVFDTAFRSDFFSMLRSWHNNRAMIPIWKQLDLTLVTSTEPYQLIENLNQSPFNVGQVIELTDFLPQSVHDLNQRHGTPLDPAREQQLMTLVGGHPYLVRRALYLIASDQMTVAELFADAVKDRGPFGDHLRYHLFRMNDKPALIEGMLQVIRHQTCPDERVFFRLRGAGLVRRQDRAVVPRCQLYAEYFQEHLYG